MPLRPGSGMDRYDVPLVGIVEYDATDRTYPHAPRRNILVVPRIWYNGQSNLASTSPMVHCVSDPHETDVPTRNDFLPKPIGMPIRRVQYGVVVAMVIVALHSVPENRYCN